METQLIKVIQDIEQIKIEISGVKKRVDKHGDEIDTLDSTFKDFKTDIALIKQATIYSEIILKEIKNELVIIRKEREQDHYIKPLENSARLVWQIVGIVVAIVIGFLVKSLFPTII